MLSIGPDAYYNLVKSNMLCEEIAEELMKDSDHVKDIRKPELMEFLQHSDKYIF